MIKTVARSLLIFSLFSSHLSSAQDYEVIQVYTQDELNALVRENKHLQRVKADDCQLVQDIEAHALKIQEPSYVYLWGDMLAWGVCVDRDAILGMYYIHEAANKGLLAAIEQLGRYYNNGTLVIQDKEKAIRYFREAALLGHLNAKINYIKLLNQGYGSPYDYEEAYHALYNTVFENKKVKADAKQQLAKLATKMPEYAIKSAQRSEQF
ncbi:flagellar protein MotX [Psychromonas sp. 14N.309.X.WAT.B.A12]|uniref:tetratricopeptide repeat protein n=1 Tax=Psychromonas sp. 14N.309.X.WAT.B.A12 TaxID=2998322 RepID=UPI0025AFF5AF|nr:flagellar protein MotX [Psychromonas sp. 14N.309.X.WAT.B.A12]MDN2664367.1 flagellar protein MotX [Psychromonas sp. 14N.309.X.WAT.B.A12]